MTTAQDAAALAEVERVLVAARVRAQAALARGERVSLRLQIRLDPAAGQLVVAELTVRGGYSN